MPEFAQRQQRTQSSHLYRPARTEGTNAHPAPVEYPLLAQQQAMGNQAMQRLLHAGMIQAKLTINEPGDQYEQEADRVAEQVMRMPDPGITERAAVGGQAPGVHIQRMCPECEEELHRQTQVSHIQRMCPNVRKTAPRADEEEEEETLQAKEISRPALLRSPQTVQAQVNAMRGGGQPLPESVRTFFRAALWL